MRSTAPQGCEAVRRSLRRSTASPAEHGLARMPALGVVGSIWSRQDASCHALDEERSALGASRNRRRTASSGEHGMTGSHPWVLSEVGRCGRTPPAQYYRSTPRCGRMPPKTKRAKQHAAAAGCQQRLTSVFFRACAKPLAELPGFPAVLSPLSKSADSHFSFDEPRALAPLLLWSFHGHQ